MSRDTASPAAPRGGFGNRGIFLGRIFGVGVTLDWSLILIFALITLTLAGGLLPAWHPDWGAVAVFLTAAAAAVLFLASVLAHELTHALVGRRLGVRMERITLFVFGGMAHMENEPRRWWEELLIAVSGPVLSILLGIAFLLLAGVAAGPVQVDPDDPLATVAQLNPFATVLMWLGPVNIVLGLFNLVPGFPLDGGRVLRAVLWGIGGNFTQATRWAAAGGQVFAWVLIGSGFLMILGVEVPVFGRGPVAGLWIALIGWFLNNAALMSWRRVQVEETLGDVPVARVMHRDFATLGPGDSVRELVDRYLLGSSQRAFPVVEDGRLVGIVCLDDVRGVEAERRAGTRVGEIMTPAERLAVLSKEDAASEALTRLATHRVNQLPVVADGRLLGLVTREDILKWISLRQGAGDRNDPARGA